MRRRRSGGGFTTLGALFIAALFVAGTTQVRADDRGDKRRRERLLSSGLTQVSLDPYRASNYEPTATGVVWSTWVVHSVNTTIAVHARVTRPSASQNWSVRILDQNDRESEIIRGSEPCWDTGGCWTMPIDGGTALVQLQIASAPNDVKIELDAYQYANLTMEAEGTVGDDDKIDLQEASARARALAPAVARLYIGTWQAYCTGFLVAPDLLLTNQHCIADNTDALSTTAEFQYQKPQAVPEARYRVTKLEVADYSLDYAVVRLKGKAGEHYGRLRLDPAPEPALAINQKLLVIQHPNGMPKMVVERACVIAATSMLGVGGSETDFGHTCDTLRGSSGSPVIRLGDSPAGDAVVGLHHWDFDDAARPRNQAVRVSEILRDIRDTRHLSPIADELTAQ